MRKMFLDDLPKIESNIERIDWKKCRGKHIKFIYDDIEGWVEIIDYTNGKHSKITIKDKEVIYKISVDSFKKCQIGKIIGTRTSEYRYNIGDIIETKTGKIEILEQIRVDNGGNKTRKGYKYKCLTCDNIDIGSENKLMNSSGCPVCCTPSQKVLIGYNDMATTDSWMIEWLVNKEDAYKYTSKSSQKVWFKCINCGNEVYKRINKFYMDGIACKKCGDFQSYPNKFAFNLLEQLSIDFEAEYSPDWIGRKRYDFYFELENKKYILEMDGEWHTNDNDMSGQTKDESKVIDNYKDELAKEHGIEVIRIDCACGGGEAFTYIKEKILNNEKLNELFDLSNINWIECHKYSISNSRIKLVCDIWNSGIHNQREIFKMTNINVGVIQKYLKKGGLAGLCDYVASNNTLKNNRKMKRTNKTKDYRVVCLNTKQIFNSISEAGQTTNSSQTHISACCNGTRLSCGELFGERLVWKKYGDYIKMTDAEIESLIFKVNNVKRGVARPIICIETECVYLSAREADRQMGITFQAINHNLKHRAKNASGFTFKYIEDLTSEEYIKYEIENKLKELNPIESIITVEEDKHEKKIRKRKTKVVICINTKQVFNSIVEANQFLNKSTKDSSISAVCRGYKKSCGKSKDGTPLKWMYYEDYIKQNQILIHNKNLGQAITQ